MDNNNITVRIKYVHHILLFKVDIVYGYIALLTIGGGGVDAL